jgi:hypothetical protein
MVTPGISQVQYPATVLPLFRAVAISERVPYIPPIARTASDDWTMTAFLAWPSPERIVTER